jgi:hypothetical protein
MLDHCARCKRETSLEVMSRQQVLTDRGGLVWWREDLRCSRCGWTDVDYVTNPTPTSPPDPLSKALERGRKNPGTDPLPVVVDREIERRLSPVVVPVVVNVPGWAIRGKIRKFEE